MRYWLALLALFVTPAYAADEIPFPDITCETTTTAGTGTVDLAGALAGGYLPFATQVTSGNSVFYNIVTGTGGSRKVEVGKGVFTDAAPDTLTRVADWSTDGVGAELTLSGTSRVCIDVSGAYFNQGAGSGLNADFLDGISSASFLQNLVEDLSPQLGANLDANTFNLLFDDNTGILDESGNEQLIFQTTATAVNQWEMTNSAANGVQRLAATGGDAAIAITLASKSTDPINFEVNGSNQVSISSTAMYPSTDNGQDLGILDTNRWSGIYVNAEINLDNQANLNFYESDGNGNNFLNFQAPAAITTDQTCVFENDANFIPDSCVGDGVDGSGEESFIIAASDEVTNIAAGTGKVFWRMPYAFTVVGIPTCSLTTAQTAGGLVTVDINEGAATAAGGSPVSILGTKITIDNSETSSAFAATAATVTDTSIAANAEMSIDIDSIGTPLAKGLKCTIVGHQT